MIVPLCKYKAHQIFTDSNERDWKELDHEQLETYKKKCNGNSTTTIS